MENSLRMRKRLKRNYKGTDHHGAAADYQESEQASTASSLGETPLPAGAPKLAPEEDAFEETGDDELRDQGEREEERGEMSRMEPSKNSTDGSGSSVPVSPQAPSAAAAAAAGAAALATESKDKLLLEIPAAMVQPLRVLRGRFQVLHLSHLENFYMKYLGSASPGSVRFHIGLAQSPFVLQNTAADGAVPVYR
jgi:hypothetical protein